MTHPGYSYCWCIITILCLMNYFWAVMLLQSGFAKCKRKDNKFRAEWEEEGIETKKEEVDTSKKEENLEDKDGKKKEEYDDAIDKKDNSMSRNR